LISARARCLAPLLLRRFPVGQVFALLLVSLSAIGSGCRLDVAIETSNLGCDDGRCPRGFDCVERVCVPVDAPPPNAGTCNQATLVADDFEHGARLELWGRAYTAQGASTAVAGGHLRIDLAANAGTPAYAGYATDLYYDLTGSHFGAEIAHMVDTSSHAVMQLQILRSGDGASADSEVAGFRQEHGELHMFTRVRGVESDLAVAYDRAAQRFWRVREQAGQLYFETSADGQAWKTGRRVSTPFDVTLVRLEVSAGVYQAEASPGVAEFAAVNGGVPAGAPCKLATLVDDFDDDARAQRWVRAYSVPGCTTGEEDGRFVGDGPDPARADTFCAYVSAAAYDLRDSQLALEITDMIDTGPDTAGVAFVKLTSDEDTHGIEMIVYLGRLTCRVWQRGEVSDVDSTAWDAEAARYWRFREQDGVITWETSPDAVGWDERCQVDSGSVDVRDVTVSLGVGAFFTSDSAGVGRFGVDNLNRL
jgi:hypothetical protein